MFTSQIENLARNILEQARNQHFMVATAESCTGGLIAAALTEIAGSSDVFDRGFVTYSNEAKNQILNVSSESLTRFGAVSEAVAKEMAFGAIANSRADISVSVTGIAGPTGGTADKPVGLVWFGVCRIGESPTAHKMLFEAPDRAGIRQSAVLTGLTLLSEALGA